MSLESTTTIKSKLATGLGAKANQYWSLLQQFLAATISRTEFDEQIRECLDTSQLVQLHNALIISIFDPSAHLAALTPPPDAPKGPPRKRRRLLPYQGPDPNEPLTLRSSRLKQWTLGLGRRERERVRTFNPTALSDRKPQPRPHEDEITAERGVRLLPEHEHAPGFRPAVHLASSARGFTLQHITDRINLICAQHNIGASRNVSSLLSLAFEAKLKQLITQALALTTASHAITSIHPSAPHSSGHLLTASAFDTLFTMSPAVLPNQSATAMRLALGENEPRDDPVLTDDRREPDDPAWQLLALLRERSAVNQAMHSWG